AAWRQPPRPLRLWVQSRDTLTREHESDDCTWSRRSSGAIYSAAMSNRPMGMALAVAALGAAACGPAPYATSPEPEQEVVYVVSPPPARADEPADGRPFAPGQVWSGSYVCPQGRTALRLIIVHVDGDRLEAIFDFHHAPSGARGSYVIRGSRD